MKTNNNEDQDVLDSIIKDRSVRQMVTKESHGMFFHIYFPHYIKYPLAEFHKDIFRITEDQSNNLACIVAFRGSGKSTLVTFSYSLWSILGIQQKKFVLIICQTQSQAKYHMTNLKYELEQNKLLRSDLGPFREEVNAGDWAVSSLVFQNTGARIMIASSEQSIRGVRHHEHRPDLIILDDIEDLNSTKTIEGRNKTFDWFTREIIPLGDIGTRIILVGNLLHEDALMTRLRKKIVADEIKGIFRWFPLLDKDKKCLWPGKFDTPEKIEDLRKKVGNELAWQQEYLLNIINDHTKVIHTDWIQYYDVLPTGVSSEVYMGVDLAISEAETADYTAIVSARVFGTGKDRKIYILPNMINKRMGYPAVIDTIDALAKSLLVTTRPTVVVESNGFQKIYADQLSSRGLQVKEVRNSSDKRTRLAIISEYIRNGTILFPRQNSKLLISQLTGFGIENHDDLADALSTMVIDLIQNPRPRPSILWLDSRGGTGYHTPRENGLSDFEMGL